MRPYLILHSVLLENVGRLQHCELLDPSGKGRSTKNKF